MAHSSWTSDKPGVVRVMPWHYGLYHYTVPIWENYILHALRFLKPDTYLAYEFCSWRKALHRGVGQCGQQSMAVIGFLQEHGYRTGFVYLAGHVVATAEVAPGQWYVLDPDYRVYMPHDLAALIAQPTLLRSYYDGKDGGSITYLRGAPRIELGGPSSRYPRACRIEQAAYIAKWAIPALLLSGVAGLQLRGRRRGYEPALSARRMA
jgi:hypothetical protein